MIYIDKGTTNDFILTLTESATITNPVWLFKFTWETDVTGVDALYWIGTDTSAYAYRYNAFELVEGTDVTFRLGQYTYEVYEADSGTTPTDETGLTKVEEGRMIVNGTGNTIYD